MKTLDGIEIEVGDLIQVKLEKIEKCDVDADNVASPIGLVLEVHEYYYNDEEDMEAIPPHLCGYYRAKWIPSTTYDSYGERIIRNKGIFGHPPKDGNRVLRIISKARNH